MIGMVVFFGSILGLSLFQEIFHILKCSLEFITDAVLFRRALSRL